MDGRRAVGESRETEAVSGIGGALDGGRRRLERSEDRGVPIRSEKPWVEGEQGPLAWAPGGRSMSTTGPAEMLPGRSVLHLGPLIRHLRVRQWLDL